MIALCGCRSGTFRNALGHELLKGNTNGSKVKGKVQILILTLDRPICCLYAKIRNWSQYQTFLKALSVLVCTPWFWNEGNSYLKNHSACTQEVRRKFWSCFQLLLRTPGNGAFQNRSKTMLDLLQKTGCIAQESIYVVPRNVSRRCRCN